MISTQKQDQVWGRTGSDSEIWWVWNMSGYGLNWTGPGVRPQMSNILFQGCASRLTVTKDNLDYPWPQWGQAKRDKGNCLWGALKKKKKKNSLSALSRKDEGKIIFHLLWFLVTRIGSAGSTLVTLGAGRLDPEKQAEVTKRWEFLPKLFLPNF